MPPVRILRALGIITSNVTEISLLHFSLTTVERSWEKRHKIWTFELTRGTNQTSIHSTPSAKSESGSTTFTASSSEHLCSKAQARCIFNPTSTKFSQQEATYSSCRREREGGRKKRSFSYTSECPFSVPRTQSCPQISPDNTASLHLPEKEIAGERNDWQN